MLRPGSVAAFPLENVILLAIADHLADAIPDEPASNLVEVLE